MYRMFVKRLLDIIISALSLLIFLPLLLVLALLVRIKLGSPVIFAQKRPGLKGNVFTIYKFRTMLEARDKNGEPLPDLQRLTRFGKILRSTSMDELPELWNILRGDMSLVGPRPLLIEYLPLYSKEQNRRHDVRPGLTGYAQVRGRNAIRWKEKFEMDAYYVDHLSFLMDCGIMFRTIGAVFARRGISSANSVTMEPFTGNDG